MPYVYVCICATHICAVYMCYIHMYTHKKNVSQDLNRTYVVCMYIRRTFCLDPAIRFLARCTGFEGSLVQRWNLACDLVDKASRPLAMGGALIHLYMMFHYIWRRNWGWIKTPFLLCVNIMPMLPLCVTVVLMLEPTWYGYHNAYCGIYPHMPVQCPALLFTYLRLL